MLDRKSAIKEGIPLLILILCVILFFSKVLFSGKALYGSDFVYQFYPWKKFVYDSLRSNGSIPLWNPYLFSGIPFISNIQASMFYPLGFLYYLLPPDVAYGYSTALHCILGSIFMYAFLRSLSVSTWGSFLSSVIFTFNGYFLGHLYAGHLSFVQVYIWIPLIFFFMWRFLQRDSYRYALLSGLALGVQILGGFPQVAFYTILGLALFALYAGISMARSRDLRRAVRSVLGFLVIAVIGFALASIQVIPTMEFAMLSTRAGGVSYGFATYDSLHPKELLSFLVPYIFGSPVDGTYWRSEEVWHFWETCGYVGILPFFLAFLGSRKDRPGRVRFFFLGLILLSLFLALGKYNPLYPLVYRLPGFNSFRIPAQIIFLYVFGIAVLSGLGLDRALGGGWKLEKSRTCLLVLLGALLLVLIVGITGFRYATFFYLFRFFAIDPIRDAQLVGLFERVSHSVFQSALIFLVVAVLLWILGKRRLRQGIFIGLISSLLVADLFLFGSEFIATYDFKTAPEKEQVLAQLPQNPAQGRVITSNDLFQVNDGLRYRFPSVLGYDPLILRRYVEYVLAAQNLDGRHPEGIVNLARIKDPEAKLIGLLNARYLVSPKGVGVLKDRVPYANLVSQSVVKASEEILPFMKGDEFDPRSMVVLERGVEEKAMIPKERSRESGSSWSVVAYGNDELKIRVKTKKPAYLVLSEIFYPGWRAEVDGKDVDVLRGNYVFRVLPLEAGEHDVRLYFVSWPFRIGAVVSLITVLLSLVLLLRRRNL